MKTTKKVIEKLTEKHNLDGYEQELIAKLRKERPKLTTILRSVSSSGMSRQIDVYWLRGSEKVYLTALVSKIVGYSRNCKSRALKVGGCGMDMGFAVVYDFSSYIFPEGFRLQKSEQGRNNDPSPVDKDGGYALKQEWL